MQTQETAVQGESRAGAQPHEGSGQEGGGRRHAAARAAAPSTHPDLFPEPSQAV